jgi:hypothetical protein
VNALASIHGQLRDAEEPGRGLAVAAELSAAAHHDQEDFVDDVLGVVARSREAPDPTVHVIDVPLIDAIKHIVGCIPSHRRVLTARYFESIHLTPLTVLWAMP